MKLLEYFILYSATSCPYCNFVYCIYYYYYYACRFLHAHERCNYFRMCKMPDSSQLFHGVIVLVLAIYILIFWQTHPKWKQNKINFRNKFYFWRNYFDVEGCCIIIWQAVKENSTQRKFFNASNNLETL